MTGTLYQEIREDIKQKIINGQYPIDAKLPSEPQLQVKYGVSRVTVRNAVDRLVQEGYVTRIQGKGTFVNTGKKVKRLLRHSAIESFSEIAKQNGLHAAAQVVSVGKEKVLAKIRPYLSSPALGVKRVRYVNNTALILENNFFPLPRFADLTKYDLTKSLYQIFYSKYAVHQLISRKSTVSMVQADKEKADLLNCSPGFPLFLLDAVITDSDGKVVQAAEEFILSNMYQFEI